MSTKWSKLVKSPKSSKSLKPSKFRKIRKIREIKTNTVLFFPIQGSNDANFQFMATFIPENETTSVIGSHGSTLHAVLPSSYKILNLDFLLKKKIRQCNSKVTRLTPCIMKSYEKLFGKNYNKEVKKYTNLTDLIFSDTEGLLSFTNCQQPCQSIDYQTKG